MAGIKHKPSTGKLTRARWQEAHDVESLDLIGQTSDPASPVDGQAWYRSDLGQLRGRVNGRVVILSEPGDEPVEQLVTSTAAGLAATTNGQLFAVASGGSIGIYRNFGGAAVLARGNFQTVPVPAVAPAAPAIVASAQALKQGGVPLKLALSRSYSSGNDGAAILNASLPDIFANGLQVSDTDGLEVGLAQPVDIVAGWDFELSRKTGLLRKFAGGEALFRTAVFAPSTTLSGVRWRGGKIIGSSTFSGPIIRAWAHNMQLSWIEIINNNPYSGSGAAMRLGGNGVGVDHCLVETNATGTGCDPYRYLGGTGFSGSYLWAWGTGRTQLSEDCFALLPHCDNPDDPHYGASIFDAYFDHCYGLTKTKLCVLGFLTSAATTRHEVDGVIHRAGFRDIGGVFGQTLLSIINDEGRDDGAGNAATPDQIDMITLRGLRGEQKRLTDPNNDRAAVISAEKRALRRAIGTVYLDDITMTGVSALIGLSLNAPGARIVGTERMRLEGIQNALQMADDMDVTIGGVLRVTDPAIAVNDEPGTDRNRHVINMYDSTLGTLRLLDDTVLEGVGAPTIDGAATAMSGVNMNAGKLRTGRLVINKLPGVSGTKAFASAAGANIEAGEIAGTVDHPMTWGSAGTKRDMSPSNLLTGRTTSTVANLPAPSLGARAMVTDATVTTFGTIVVGGGSNTVPVYSGGSSWRIG